MTGHVRALGVVQAQESFERVGFSDVRMAFIGLMPRPDRLGRVLEPVMPRWEYLLPVEAKKPADAAPAPHALSGTR